MHGVHGLKGPYHHLELGDHAVVVAGDDVDAVHVFAVDGGLKLEDRVVTVEDLLDVSERAVTSAGDRLADIGCLTRERHRGGVEVELGDLLALLWGEDDRGDEHHVVVEEGVETAGEFSPQMLVPAVDDVVDRIHGVTVTGGPRLGLWQGGEVSDVEDRVRAAVAATGGPWREVACDPDLADTAAFCDRYGFSPADSANTIVVASKGESPVMAACLVLATHRLDVNGVVRRRLGARKVSFAPAELTAEVTGMVMGGVTPFGLPEGLAVWVDAAVFERAEIIVGGGSRSMKLVLPPSTLASLDSVEVVEGLARPIPAD